MPDDAEGFAVDDDFGEVFDFAEVEPEVGALGEPGGSGVDGFGVGAGAGEVFDAGVGVVAPGG